MLIDVYFKQLKIRIIVLSRMSKSPKNALWQLFSAQRDKVIYGTEHYSWHSDDVSSVMNELYEKYAEEGLKMSFTLEDYRKSEEYHNSIRKILSVLPAEQRLEGISLEQRLAGAKPEEIIQVMLEQRLAGVEPKELIQVMFKLLPPEQIKAYLAQLEKEQANKH